MTVSIDGNPVLTLRAWAKAYRDGPAEYRFPSDPNAEFFPRDMESAANKIERLQRGVESIQNWLRRNASAEKEPKARAALVEAQNAVLQIANETQ